MNIINKTILTVALSAAALSSMASAGENNPQNKSKPTQKQVVQVSPEEVAAKANWCEYQYFCTPFACSYRYICW